VLPEALSQYQYGVPAALTFQSIPTPHRALTPQQQLGYQSQLAFRGSGAETVSTFFTRLEYRVRYYRFFFLAPLYVALAVFLLRRQWWILATLALFALGTNLFPAFQYHYVAAATCLFVLASVLGLEALPRPAAHVIFFLCAAHFVFWYTLHVADDQPFSLAMRHYETGDYINHRNPERRIFVNRALAQIPEKLLILVRYWPQHAFQEEWVYNAADIDDARIVWARDLGDTENEKLKRLYPERTVLLLEPDAQPPKLSPYQMSQPAQPQPPAPSPFEDVPPAKP